MVSSSCSTSGTRRFNLDWFYSEKNFKIPKGWSVTAKDNIMAKWKRQTTQWPNEKERQHNGQMKKRDNTVAKWKRQTTQWPNEKGQKDTKRSSNTNPTKTEDEIMCSIRISSFWSTCDICRITLVTHLSYYSCYTPVVLLLLHTCRITLVTHLSY
jgi:hypothetical protein